MDDPLAKLDQIRRKARYLLWVVSLNLFLTTILFIWIVYER
jgi:hypothetical protein